MRVADGVLSAVAGHGKEALVLRGSWVLKSAAADAALPPGGGLFCFLCRFCVTCEKHFHVSWGHRSSSHRLVSESPFVLSP